MFRNRICQRHKKQWCWWEHGKEAIKNMRNIIAIVYGISGEQISSKFTWATWAWGSKWRCKSFSLDSHGIVIDKVIIRKWLSVITLSLWGTVRKEVFLSYIERLKTKVESTSIFQRNFNKVFFFNACFTTLFRLFFNVGKMLKFRLRKRVKIPKFI